MFRLRNLDLGLESRISDLATKYKIQNQISTFIVEIQPQGGFQLRYPELDFMDFLLYHFIGKTEKGFVKLFSGTLVFFYLLCMCVLDCCSWECRLSFSNPFSHFPIRLKETWGNPRTDFSQFTSVLGFHMLLKIIYPDFKIYKIQIFQWNASQALIPRVLIIFVWT